MHHALFFSTSKHSSSDSDAASWLVDFADAFAAITGPVAALCSFHDHRANLMHVRDSKILGTI